MTDDLTTQITQILRDEYLALDDAGAVSIDPTYLAEHARKRLDPNNESPALMSWAAVLEFRQLARSICRARLKAEEESVEQQADLFSGQLQGRYPAVRHGREQYVLRSELTLAERMQNITRLLAEAESKQRHARALQAETDSLQARGLLREAA